MKISSYNEFVNSNIVCHTDEENILKFQSTLNILNTQGFEETILFPFLARANIFWRKYNYMFTGSKLDSKCQFSV
jgi:hypothetical protein